MNFRNDEDTIIAEVSPAGRGAVSLLRLSGANSLLSTAKLMKKNRESFVSHSAITGFLFDSSSKKKIDQVICIPFLNGRSFTGEEVVEISCHGNPLIVNQIIKAYLDTGLVRLAQPGEFSYRSVMNGKIDLVQAEAIHDLIQSQNGFSLTWGLRQLEGELSLYLSGIKEKLTEILAHFEAQIDYSDQDIDPQAPSDFILSLKDIENKLCLKINSFKTGSQIKQGLRVALVGLPNSGKSSLFNSLLGDDRAIVSNIPGTTRDILEGKLEIEGFPFSLFDMAGIRDTDDFIESIGVERARSMLEKSDIVLYLFDGQLLPLESEINFIKSSIRNEEFIFVINKKDISNNSVIVDQIRRHFKNEILFCSSLTSDGIKEIFSFLKKKRDSLISSSLEFPLNNSRHYESFCIMHDFVLKSIKSIESKVSVEFIIFELKQALEESLKIMGQSFDDQIMDEVFSRFCLGK